MTNDPNRNPLDRQLNPTSTSASLDHELERLFPDSIVKQGYTRGESTMKSSGYPASTGPAGTPSGGLAERPPPIFLGAPSKTQTLGPLALLSEVTEHALQLREVAKTLVRVITGEAPAERPVSLSRSPGRPAGLLPTIAVLATQIDAAHSDIARMLEQLRRQL